MTPGIDYAKFSILLDAPADEPQLGFGVYADAFAQIIELSPARFAIGIFGDWGSGKTTLMKAIASRIELKPAQMVPVWFNAWRYEREEHLIVPLLDNIRDGLLTWRTKHGDQTTKANATKAASKFARASRRVVGGLTLKGGIPGFEASLAFDKVLAAPGPRAGPASFYHAAFRDMQQATASFTASDGSPRIVVFIDDLDRCLPASALQVLESMKLFFDLEGFVFVVGLDQDVIERAIETKYEAGSTTATVHTIIEREAPDGAGQQRSDPAAPNGHQAPVSGADYIKKIFQVPFTLPRLGRDQIGELLNALRSTPGLLAEQRDDLQQKVSRHLPYLTDQNSVNPREVKRLINAYTLQMKLLYPRLGPATNPDVVLALQLIGFRPDWERVHEVLLTDTDAFVADTRRAIKETGADELFMGEENAPIPPSFLDYFRGPADSLLDDPDLPQYLSSAEQSRTTDSVGIDARQTLSRIRRALRAATGGAALNRSELDGNVSQLSSLLDRATYGAGGERLQSLLNELSSSIRKFTSDAGPERAEIERLARLADRIADTLFDLRRRASLGPS